MISKFNLENSNKKKYICLLECHFFEILNWNINIRNWFWHCILAKQFYCLLLCLIQDVSLCAMFVGRYKCKTSNMPICYLPCYQSYDVRKNLSIQLHMNWHYFLQFHCCYKDGSAISLLLFFNHVLKRKCLYSGKQWIASSFMANMEIKIGKLSCRFIKSLLKHVLNNFHCVSYHYECLQSNFAICISIRYNFYALKTIVHGKACHRCSCR